MRCCCAGLGPGVGAQGLALAHDRQTYVKPPVATVGCWPVASNRCLVRWYAGTPEPHCVLVRPLAAPNRAAAAGVAGLAGMTTS